MQGLLSIRIFACGHILQQGSALFYTLIKSQCEKSKGRCVLCILCRYRTVQGICFVVIFDSYGCHMGLLFVVLLVIVNIFF